MVWTSVIKHRVNEQQTGIIVASMLEESSCAPDSFSHLFNALIQPLSLSTTRFFNHMFQVPPHVSSHVLCPVFFLLFLCAAGSCCNKPINWSNAAVCTGRVG